MVESRHIFTLVEWLDWVNVGGGCYKVASDHGSPLILDGWVFFMYSCGLHILFLYAFGLCQCCVCMALVMVAIVSPDVGCVYHEYMSFMNWLCM